MSVDPIARGLAARLLSPGEVRAEHAGAAPGVPSNGAKLTDAMVALRGANGGRLRLTPGLTYEVEANAARTLGGSVTVAANLGHVLVPPARGVSFDGNGGFLRSTVPVQALVRLEGEIVRSDPLVGPVAAGGKQLAFSSPGAAAAYAVGDDVLWRLGDDPADTNETFNWGFARVVSVNLAGNAVTLDRGLHRPWDGTGTANRHLLKLSTSRGQVVNDVRCAGNSVNGTPEIAALTIGHVIAPWIPGLTIVGARSGGGIQYVEAAHFGRVHLEDIADVGGDSNTGLGLRFAESTGRIDTLLSRNLHRHAISVEAGSDLTVGYHEDVHSAPNPTRIIAVCGAHSRIHIERALYKGAGCNLYSDTATSRVTYGSVRCELGSDPLVLPVPGRNAEEVSLRIGGVEELYRASQGTWYEFFIDFADGLDQEYNLPWGICAGCVVTLHGNATAADFTNFDVGHQFAKNNIKPALTANGGVYEQDVFAAAYAGWGASAGSNWTQRRNSGVAFYIKLPASGMTGSGKAVSVRMLVVPDLIRAGFSSYLDSSDVKRWNGV